MQTRAARFPHGFFFVSMILIVLGSAGHVFSYATVPNVARLLPPMIVTTTLCEMATAILLAVIVLRTGRRAPWVLVLLFAALAVLDTAVFFTLPLPGIGAAVASGIFAPRYFYLIWHIAIPISGIVYAIESSRDLTFDQQAARWRATVALPLAIVVAALFTIEIIAVSANVPSRLANDLITGVHAPVLGYVTSALGVVALIALGRLLLCGAAREIDYAVTLTVLAATLGSLVSLPGEPRFHLGWFTARLIYMISSTFVLVATIRDLFARYTDALQLESDSLRLEVSAYERNADVEVSMVKSQFVAKVTHELRTPLGGIIGMAEVLRRTPLSTNQRNCTDSIRSAADSLLRIVNDLLDFSRAEAGMVEIEDRPFDIGHTVEEVALLFREQTNENGVALETFIDPALPATISGDQTRVRQVLQNLIGNAVRFTSTGTIRIDIVRDTVEKRTSAVRFEVADTGIGIGAKGLERIFQPFAQEDASTSRRFGGTGLGLAIARHLVEAMGGTISVRSVVGAGSTFAFTIPFRPVNARSGSSPTLRDLHVVTVEPDAGTRSLLERYMAGWEMLGAAFASADEACARLEDPSSAARSVDVLIVGPGIASADAARIVREYARAGGDRARTRALLLRDAASDDAAAIPTGFQSVVNGPIRQSTLLDAIVNLRRRTGPGDAVSGARAISKRPARAERVLVVDDSKVNRDVLELQLEHLGFTCDVTGDGESAIQLAYENDYDIVFMDCQLPGIDGFDAARTIRRSSRRNADMPIVAVTANVMPGYRDVCLAAGMNECLVKPALIVPLTEVVDRFLPGACPVPEVASPRASTDPRERLLAIFNGDETRVDATIARALDSLREGVFALRTSLDTRNIEASAGAAHKLRGVAIEIGLQLVAQEATSLESDIRAGAWEDANASHTRLIKAIVRESGALRDRAAA